MATIKQLNTKNRTYYFYDDLINLKDVPGVMLQDFDPNLLT